MTSRWRPELRVVESGKGCRLTLAGVASGSGATLQEAADDLVARLLVLAAGVRRGDLRIPSELGTPDVRVLEFLWTVGELADRGEDVREDVLGPADGA